MRFLAFLVLLVAFLPVHAANDIRQFAFGIGHEHCSLTAEGAVDCIGWKDAFRPVRVIAGGARKVVIGDARACAIVGDALQCWSHPADADNTAPKPTTLIDHGVTDVSVFGLTCAVVGGAVQCIDAPDGPGAYQAADAKPALKTIVASGASAVAVGDQFGCAVAEGALLCWGYVPWYSYVPGLTVATALPPTRLIEHGVIAVAAGTKHVCAIVNETSAEGALRCFGDNTHGQAGIVIPDASAPATPAGRSMIFDDGDQRCGRWNFETRYSICTVEHPVEVIHDGVESVVAKSNATCAVVRGTLYCWGANNADQLGIASHGKDVTKPTVAVARGVGYAATGDRTCAIVDGALQCSRPCARGTHDDWVCPPDAGFEARNLPFGLPPLEARLGVWRGTISTHVIMACLRRDSWESQYYYAEHRDSIALQLEQNSDGADWIEYARNGGESATAKWALDEAHGDTLTGQWSDAAKQRTLPINLTRVAPLDDPDSSCSDADKPAGRAFNAPRIDAQAIETTPRAGGTRQRSALGGKVSMEELVDGAPHADVFNAAMRDWLRNIIAGYYDCESSAPNGSEYEYHRDIAWRASAWVIVRETYDAYCGGAHPDGGVAGYELWNLDQGKTVNPWRWIVASGKKYDDCLQSCPLAGDLRNLVVAAATRGMDSTDECAGEYQDQDVWYLLSPDEKGVTFSSSFAHVIQACDNDINVPWPTLAPFLSPEGKEAMRSLQKAAATKASATPLALPLGRQQ